MLPVIRGQQRSDIYRNRFTNYSEDICLWYTKNVVSMNVPIENQQAYSRIEADFIDERFQQPKPTGADNLHAGKDRPYRGQVGR